jgi:hypothetical protein
MRTTLVLDDHLFKAAKRCAAEEGKTLTRILEEALRQYLLPRDRPRGRFTLRPLTRSGRPIPGVDLSDRDSLYERMEGRA